jgi:uncharacterized membrane protein YbhN (UPF0104 family)
LLLLAALLIFGTYLYRNANRYHELLNFSFTSILLLFGLVLVIPLANGIINYLLYRGLGVLLPLREGFGLAAVNTLANQLPFAGGLVAKGVYLKQRYDLPYTRFLSATAALYACFIAANGGVGLGVMALLSITGESTPTLLKIGFGVMTTSVLLVWSPADLGFLPSTWRERLKQLVEGGQVLSRNRMLLVQLVGVQIITTLAAAGRFWITFHALSQDVTYAQCLLFAAATILTRLVSIAPGGLGVREGIVAAVASLLGREAGVSAVAVGIDRLATTSVIIVLGTIYTYVLSAKVTDAKPMDATRAGE